MYSTCKVEDLTFKNYEIPINTKSRVLPGCQLDLPKQLSLHHFDELSIWRHNKILKLLCKAFIFFRCVNIWLGLNIIQIEEWMQRAEGKVYIHLISKLKTFKAFEGSYRAEAQSNPCSVHRWNPSHCCVQTSREHLFQILYLFGNLSAGLCKENGASG